MKQACLGGGATHAHAWTRRGCQATAVAPNSTQAPKIYQGSSTVKGTLKSENQDRVVVLSELGRLCEVAGGGKQAARNIVFSAVFDGHGGCEAAAHAAQRLQDLVATSVPVWKSIDEAMRHVVEGPMDALHEQLKQTWHEVFRSLDSEIIDRSRSSGLCDGSTALAGLHFQQCLFVANAGDCRAVLGRGRGALRLTCDHKPDVQSERQRIEANGGRVKVHHGVWRVALPLGGHAKLCGTSRGLGDSDFKEKQLITCEPDVAVVSLQRADQFSVFASDGLWAFVEDQDVVDAVQGVVDEYSRMLMPTSLKAAAGAAARKLVKLALDRGSVDDISVVVHVYDWR